MSEPSSRSLEQVRKLYYDPTPIGSVIRPMMERVALALDAARAEERERCARIVESFHDDGSMDWCGFNSAPIAELIRKSEERTS